MLKRTVIIGLTIAVILDTGGQLLWKFSASHIASTTIEQLLPAIVHEPYFLIVSAIFFCQFINWMLLIKKVDLSLAQPITSLSYVTVCILSAVMFGEQLGIIKILGIACVLAGVWYVSYHKNPAKESKP